jgi:hypothetical protein
MLKEILERYKDAKAQANIVPEEMAPAVSAGGFALKRNGQRLMRESEAEYLDYIPKILKVIALSGDYSKQFSDIATRLSGIITYDFTGLVDELTNAIKSRSHRPNFSNQEYEMLMDELNKLKVELGIQSLANPEFSTNDKAANLPIRESVQLLIDRTFGNDLYALAAIRRISKQAFEKKFAGENFPVIIYNHRNSPTQFLPVPVRAADIDSEVTEKDVAGALHGINSSLKGILNDLKPKQTKKPKETTNTLE